MNNFLEFINDDIEAKQTLLSTMPTNTKTNIKKYNEKIDNIHKKYIEYKLSVKKYLDAKSKSFTLKKTNKNTEELNNVLSKLKKVRLILNPFNTYFEKMGFDSLVYQMSNYKNFSFKNVNEIINSFIDKFELVGIELNTHSFNYTIYVNEYMTAFMEARKDKTKNYDRVSQIFEKIYWVNPEIIEHIELNFRKLIKKYDKNFVNYINKLQKQALVENKINNYSDCIEKIKSTYIKLKEEQKENIFDIIEMAKNGTIEINNYFIDSKTRVSTYEELTIRPLTFDDKTIMSKFYSSLEKLKFNIEEYGNYVKFLPLINDFKNEYEKQVSIIDKNTKTTSEVKSLKTIEIQISDKESKLEKINKKIFGHDSGLFDFMVKHDDKQLKIDSVNYAKELYQLYKTYDKELFKRRILSILNKSLTVFELFNLYNSFDYFKKDAIKKVFEINSYEDIIKYNDEFDSFAENPTNIIINSLSIFDKNDIANVIINKYRMDNIDLNDENLNPDTLDVLLEKIKLMLRVNIIENSSTNVEKIWFMSEIEKINMIESKKTS